MVSRNKREGYYFGKDYDWNWEPDYDKYLNKHLSTKYNRQRHQRTKDFSTSLKGWFK